MYRLPEVAVPRLIEQLTLHGEWLSADAEAEVVLDHPGLALLERGAMLSIRFGLADGFSEIRLEGVKPETKSAARILAAGPVEDTLLALGFREVRRTVTLKQAFTVDQVRVDVLHVEPIGWFCQIRPPPDASPDALEELKERLELWRFGLEPSVDAETPVPLTQIRDRFGGRRRQERRVGAARRLASERRGGQDRRVGPAERRQVG
jgi:adenylate cyclase class IV